MRGVFQGGDVSRRTALSVLTIAAATITVLAVPSAAVPAVASTPVVFTVNDTAPDMPGAPDISSISVSDNPSGLITIGFSLAGGAPLPTTDTIGFYIDSDQNPTTGDFGAVGADYLIVYDASD